MQINQNVAKDMLQNISDPRMREVYGNILSGKIVAQVRCMAKCKGRVIAIIYDNNNIEELPPVIDRKSKNGIYSSGLEGSRIRLDGQLGFRCYCGNSSILCQEEQGVITPARPTDADITKIANRLSRRTGNEYKPRGGKIKIDSFVIEDVKV